MSESQTNDWLKMRSTRCCEMPAQNVPTVSSDEIAGAIRDDRTGDPAALRSSPSRRSLLDGYAVVLADEDVTVSFETRDGETARVTLGTTPPQISVPSWEIPQPVTSVPRRAYDLLLQRTLTAHEVAHVNYTDNAALAATESSLPPDERPAFHSLFNALEDGAIEEQLRQAFNIADALAVTNANVRFSYDDDDRVYDLLAATVLAGLDLAVFDSGTLGRLLDPSDGPSFASTEMRRRFVDHILGPLAEAAEDVVSEPDGAIRVERVKKLWEDIHDEFDSLEPPESPTPKGSVPADVDADAAGSVPADGLSSDTGQSTDGDTDGSTAAGTTNSPDSSGSGADNSKEGTVSDGSSSESKADSTGSDETNNTGPTSASDSDQVADGSVGEDVDGPDSSKQDGPMGSATSSDSGEDSSESGSDGASGRNQSGAAGEFDPEFPDDESPPDTASEGTKHESQSGTSNDDGKDPNDESAKNVNDSPAARPDNESDTDDVSRATDRSTATDKTSADERSDDETDRSGQKESDEQSADNNAADTIGSDGTSEPEDANKPDTDESGEEDVEEVDEELSEQARNAAAEAMSRVDSQEQRDRELADDYERAAERVKETVAEIELDRIPVRQPPAGEWGGSDRWREIRRDGERLGRIFDQRLQNENQSEQQRGRRRGQVDPRSLPKLARKDPRVFRSNDRPDEKEYAIVLVLDRSGSMSGTVQVAERAVATLALALESVGVETCLVEMYRSSARIAVPFTVETADVPEALLTGETSGGTPLAEVLEIAREYSAQTDGNPAMITVTDGKPSDEAAYFEQLRQTSFPVLGVYVDLSARTQRRAIERHNESAAYYDQRRIVVDPDELTQTLEQLAQEVMF